MRRNLLLVGLTLLVGVGLFFILYESTDQSDYSWEETYHPLKSEPYDISGFHQILSRQFPESTIIPRYRDTLLSEVLSTGNLMIYVGGYFSDYQDDSTYSALVEWVARGNTALIIADAFFIDLVDPETDLYTDAVLNDSTIYIEYCRNDNTSDQFSKYQHENKNEYWSYNETFNSNHPRFDSVGIERLIESGDSSLIMLKMQIDSGSLLVHTIPMLYSNYAISQEFYKNHLDYTLELLPKRPSLIIVDNDIYEKFSQHASQSPIRFILSQPSLSWAYYLVLFSALLYVLFKGKRRQKPIAVLQRPENSSINYAETLAVLYSGQEQNQDLIKHLEELFYHRVKEKFFILKKDAHFSEKLARKSQFPLDKINAIRSHFSAIASKSTISDHQLGIIYGRLEDFYNHNT